MSRTSPRIAWCSRDLSDIPVGNHHFLLIDGLKPGQHADKAIPLPTGRLGFTMGANNLGRGQLEAYINDRYDLQALREAVQGVPWHQPDLDFQAHDIPLPDHRRGDELVDQLVAGFEAYQYNLQNHPPPVKYHPLGYDTNWPWCSGNCASWINSLLAAIGIPERTRRQCSDFRGLDIGQDLLLDLRYFSRNADWTLPPQPPRKPGLRVDTEREIMPADLFEDV